MRITTKVRSDGALVAICADTGDTIEGLQEVIQSAVIENGVINHTLTIKVEDIFTIRDLDA